MEKLVRSSNTSFFTRKEVAEKLRIALPTLDRHISANKLETTVVGRRRLISVEQLAAFIQKGGSK